MDGKKWIVLVLLLFGFKSFGQSFQYTYVDPCTGIPNTVTITQPLGSVTLFYAGQWQTFTAAQLQAGGYEDWVASINAQFPPGSNPCAGAGGQTTTTSNVSTATNTVMNVSSIVGIAASLGSQTTITSPSGGNQNGDTDDNNDNSGGGSSSSGTNNGGNSSSSSTSGGTSGSSSGSSSNGGNGGNGGSTGTSSGSSSGGGSSEGNNSPISTPETSTGSGVSNEGDVADSEVGALAGTSTTTTASGGDSETADSGGGGSKKKSNQEKIGRGSLIGAGDFVVIRNGNDIKAQGMDNFRFNMSLTHVNTDQTLIKGINFNYTTGQNILNSTLYGSYKKNGFMGIFSNATMTNFKTDAFNTTTILMTQKMWKVTPMLGTNFTFGKIGVSEFQNWSVVGGGFTNFSNDWFLSGNVMLLGIYSPYIFYYEGQWYRSGLLFVPLANLDIKLTNTFKWSISFGGAYQYKSDILNFQLSTGTKILL